MRSIRTEAVFSNDKLEVRMILAQLGHKPFGGIPFTIVFIRAIAVHNRLGHEWNDGPLVRMDKRGAQHLMRIGDGPIAVAPLSTRGTVNRLGRKILRTIQGQEIMAIQKRHRFQRLAALKLPKDALKDRAEPLGRDGVKYLAHVGVAWNPRDRKSTR